MALFMKDYPLVPFALSFGHWIEQVVPPLFFFFFESGGVCLPGGIRKVFHGKLNHILACWWNDYVRVSLFAVKRKIR